MFQCRYCQKIVKALSCSGCEQCEDIYPDNFNRKGAKNGERVWNKRKEKVYQKTKGMCWLCNNFLNKEDFTFDHVLPKSKGGLDSLDNLMPAHEKCNRLRGNKKVKSHG